MKETSRDLDLSLLQTLLFGNCRISVLAIAARGMSELGLATDFSGTDLNEVSIAFSYNSALANCLASGFQRGLFRKKYRQNELRNDTANV